MPKCQYRVSAFWLHSCRPYWRALIVWFTGTFQFSSCSTSVLYTWHHLIETLFSCVFAKAILSWFSFCFFPRMGVMISMSLVLVLIIFITRRTFITISLTAYCICKTGLFQTFCLTFSKPACFLIHSVLYFVSVNIAIHVLPCLKTSDSFNFSFFCSQHQTLISYYTTVIIPPKCLWNTILLVNSIVVVLVWSLIMP